jgi:hypothetical protein
MSKESNIRFITIALLIRKIVRFTSIHLLKSVKKLIKEALEHEREWSRLKK